MKLSHFGLYRKHFQILLLLETCGGYVNTNVIRHPEHNDTGYYSNNEDCMWYIQTNHTGLYRLRFTMFSTEKYYDWVRIGNRMYSSGPSNPDDYYFYNSTTLQFHSDSSGTDYGFTVEIIEVEGKLKYILITMYTTCLYYE